MNPNMRVNVIWDLTVRLFNIGRDKIVKAMRDRAQSDARWMNG